MSYNPVLTEEDVEEMASNPVLTEEDLEDDELLEFENPDDDEDDDDSQESRWSKLDEVKLSASQLEHEVNNFLKMRETVVRLGRYAVIDSSIWDEMLAEVEVYVPLEEIRADAQAVAEANTEEEAKEVEDEETLKDTNRVIWETQLTLEELKKGITILLDSLRSLSKSMVEDQHDMIRIASHAQNVILWATELERSDIEGVHQTLYEDLQRVVVWGYIHPERIINAASDVDEVAELETEDPEDSISYLHPRIESLRKKVWGVLLTVRNMSADLDTILKKNKWYEKELASL